MSEHVTARIRYLKDKHAYIHRPAHGQDPSDDPVCCAVSCQLRQMMNVGQIPPPHGFATFTAQPVLPGPGPGANATSIALHHQLGTFPLYKRRKFAS
jgi:hypothetical protein